MRVERGVDAYPQASNPFRQRLRYLWSVGSLLNTYV